jgi:tetratricopeptide (TPR) repeat protein
MTAFLVLIGLTINGRALAYDFFYWDHGATGLEAALYGAELDERPLILYFHVQDCEWCEKLNNSYLATDSVESFLMEMYKVEVDPDRGEDEAALADQYGITRFPALLVTVPTAKTESERVHPFSKDKEMSPDEFLQAIKAMIAHIYSKTAYTSFEKKAYEEALKYYRLALEYDQNNIYAYYAMGMVYEKIGEETRDIDSLGEAEMNFLKALEIDPKHEDSKKALEEVRKNMEILKR